MSRLLNTLLPLCMLIVLCSQTNGYSILGIFPTFSKSHYILASALMRGLAESGHNVTVISPIQLDKPVPNYREILVQGIDKVMAESGYTNIADLNDLTALESVFQFQEFGRIITTFTLQHPVMRDFIASRDERFDVIVVETNLNDAMIGLGQHFAAPVVGLATTGATLWSADTVGTPAPMSYVPHMFLPFTSGMSFVQRAVNVVVSGIEYVAYQSHLRMQQQLYDEVFAADRQRPDFYAMRRNLSLVLVNQHFTLNYPRPYVPNMIDVGGIHVNRRAPRALPADLQRWMDGAEHGVIYFSLGSNVQSKQLPAAVRDGLLRVFGARRERIMWKWEDDELPGRPANVLIRKWFPQDDVLAHPRVLLFITHGGLLSSTEAIYHGVPVIGVPVFCDQFLNMAQAELNGWGVKLAFRNLTGASLHWALGEALDNPRYRRNAQAISRRYRDQPMDPLQTAIYWVEYVVRHDGAAHMRVAGQDLSVVQYHNVDVYAFVALVVALVLGLARAAIRCAIGAVGGRVKTKTL